MLAGCSMRMPSFNSVPSFQQIKKTTLESIGLTPSEDERINASLTANPEDQTQDTAPMSFWWLALNDAQLNNDIALLLKQNLDLSQATQRIEQARARTATAHARLLPTLSGEAGAARNRSFFQVADITSSNYTTRYNAGLTASWELDLFGRNRKQKQAAQAALDESIYRREAIAQSLITTLIDLRVAITAQRKQRDTAQKIAENRAHAYKLINRRYRSGTANISPNEVYQEKKAVNQAKSALYEAEIQLAETLNAYDILLGGAPGTYQKTVQDFTLNARDKKYQNRLSPPTCLPATLLERRPDVKAALMGIKAERAEVSVAIRDLFPTLSIGGNAGFANASPNGLFNADQLIGSILSSIQARIFEGGALRANIRQQKAELAEASAAYAQSILQALQDGENAIKAHQELTRKVKAARKAYKADQSSENLTRERYRRGLASLYDLLGAEQLRLTSEQSYINAQQELWGAYSALNLALGGDWTSATPDIAYKNKPNCDNQASALLKYDTHRNMRKNPASQHKKINKGSHKP